MKTIEARLTDFGISGKVLRLQQFINPLQIIEEEKIKGAKTIVVVGDDNTLGYVLAHAALCGLPFGYIPVRGPSEIADTLGIPVGEEACDVLSRRRKVKIDVGKVHGTGQLFVSELQVDPAYATVVCDRKFKMTGSTAPLSIGIYNLQPHDDLPITPQDRKLSVVIRPQARKKRFSRKKIEQADETIVPFDELIISSKRPLSVRADGTVVSKKEVIITLSSEQVELIVGAERQF